MSSKQIGNLVMSRRRLLSLTAAGVTISTLGLPNIRQAHAADMVRWVSPRGTIEVLDDYPYWVGN